jgi:hypothetical protein
MVLIASGENNSRFHYVLKKNEKKEKKKKGKL